MHTRKQKNGGTRNSRTTLFVRGREAFIEFDYGLLEALGIKDNLHRLSERVQSYWENLPEEADEKIYPEVRIALKTLREKGVILGILSNGLLTTSLKSLEKHAIRGIFQMSQN